MTNHSCSQTQLPLSAPTSVVAGFPQPSGSCLFLLVPYPLMGMGFVFPPATIPVNPVVPSASPAAAAPEAALAPAAPAPAAAAAAVPPAAPSVRNPSAGLPAPLVALLRAEDGPFLANEVFSVTPTQPLEAIKEPVPAPEWYAITRGRFVGVVDQFALSAVAISGVAHAARKAYTTQGLTLAAFNQALTWGGVQVA
ncbi:hypothetical protein B0H19DRAFT_1077014 [Mycena capillaripes]|nr:hypothetical protein B0H19DRAFT_1077014 [Mycena capillaripes]